ncbi:hypothetical protein OG394_14260 [Kribbella sp. NBC_01245]|uniref:hypothetical protein n=1 Tax=Kribbella sp. NBC_01245 TaxID=2903578 RepID=UPI002E2DDB67|nr:hypothetical protein [Kribbella sp. NBC_01245]
MKTLHIEHAVTDFATWRTAFDRFAGARANAGVRNARIQRPLDDERYVLVELDFDDYDSAAGFLGFLESTVWAVPANSPALAGSPRTRILQAVD